MKKYDQDQTGAPTSYVCCSKGHSWIIDNQVWRTLFGSPHESISVELLDKVGLSNTACDRFCSASPVTHSSTPSHNESIT